MERILCHYDLINVKIVQSLLTKNYINTLYISLFINNVYVKYSQRTHVHERSGRADVECTEQKL